MLAHRQRFPLGAHQHLVARLIEVVVGDFRPAAPHGKQRRFVDKIRQLRARESRRAARDLAQIDRAVERHLLRVNPEDLLSALQVGASDRHLPIEPSRPQQRGIEDVRPIGRRNDDDAGADRKAVHLDEQLVERLLALFVAERVAAAAPADRVELVDEHDARGMTPRILEQLADARGADTGVHLDEIGTAGKQERHPRLARDRFREQGLDGAGRSNQQDPFRDASADRGKAGRFA